METYKDEFIGEKLSGNEVFYLKMKCKVVADNGDFIFVDYYFTEINGGEVYVASSGLLKSQIVNSLLE